MAVVNAWMLFSSSVMGGFNIITDGSNLSHVRGFARVENFPPAILFILYLTGLFPLQGANLSLSIPKVPEQAPLQHSITFSLVTFHLAMLTFILTFKFIKSQIFFLSQADSVSTGGSSRMSTLLPTKNMESSVLSKGSLGWALQHSRWSWTSRQMQRQGSLLPALAEHSSNR